MVNHRLFHLLNAHPRHRFAHLKLAHFHEHHNPKKAHRFHHHEPIKEIENKLESMEIGEGVKHHKRPRPLNFKM
jgi:hypothetical protein